MDPRAIEKSKSRLRSAKKALKELPDCNDFESFNDTWTTFLAASKGIYNFLEQGAKTSPSSMQWYGGIKKRRRSEPLLQYLFQARNDDEHGLSWGVEHVPGSLAIGVNKEGFSNNITLNGSFPGDLSITSNDGKPVLCEQTIPHAKLIEVSGRGATEKYAPPVSFKGEPLNDKSPINVGTIGLTELEKIIQEAESLS